MECSLMLKDYSGILLIFHLKLFLRHKMLRSEIDPSLSINENAKEKVKNSFSFIHFPIKLIFPCLKAFIGRKKK